LLCFSGRRQFRNLSTRSNHVAAIMTIAIAIAIVIVVAILTLVENEHKEK